MQDYRAYIIGPDGHVQSRVDLQCTDDVEAIKLAKQLVDGYDVELWQLDRHIETFRHTAERPVLRQSIIAGRARLSQTPLEAKTPSRGLLGIRSVPRVPGRVH